MKKISSIAIELILSICLCICIIIIGIKSVIIFKPLYYIDIYILHIDKNTYLTREQIMHVYNYLINYLIQNNSHTFAIPYLYASQSGTIHFIEVKNIFIKLDYVFYTSIFICFICLHYKLKNNNYAFLKTCCVMLLSLCSFLIISFLRNFDESFTLFHKLFFKNDYWQFDPKLDPVINILPQEFFEHCAIFILAIIFVYILFMAYIYYRNRRCFLS